MKNLSLPLKLALIWTLWLLALPPMSKAAEVAKVEPQEYQLDNGLKILIVERHQSPTFSAYIFYRVGAVDEPEGKSGMAHFIEHLMSKGTTALGTTDYEKEIPLIKRKDEIIEQLGQNDLDPETRKKLNDEFGKLEQEHRKYIVSNEIDKLYIREGSHDMNASTSYDWTNYFVSLPSNKFELWCSIESEVMRNPIFREFYSEKRVVMEERRMRFDTRARGALYEAMTQTAFAVHPYRTVVIGLMDEIARLTRKDIRDFYRRYYAPNRAVVAIVGDITAETVLPLMKKYFETIPAQPDPEPQKAVEPPQRGEKRVAVEFDANPRLILAYHKPQLTHKDQAVFDVMAEILGGSRTSRLHKRLVEDEKLAISADVGEIGSRYPNLFLFFTTLRAPHTVEEVEKAIYDEIEKIKNELVSDWELEKAKNHLAAYFLRDMETNDGLARVIGLYEVVAGDWRYLNELNQREQEVTAEMIMDVARKYFKESSRTAAFIKKKESSK